MNTYLSFGIRQGIDVVAVVTLAYGIYLRTSSRWDVAASLVALNIGLVAVLTALMAMPQGGTSGLTVGFGLFAVLSIVRLRSEASSLTEVAYFFTALALGVVNGVDLGAHVSDVQVLEVDFVRETTRVEALVTDARARGLPASPERNVIAWQRGRGRSRRPADAAPLELSRDGSGQ